MPCRRKINPPRTRTCLIAKLPEECKQRILKFLPAEDVTDLRLSSKEWARTGIRGPFNAQRIINAWALDIETAIIENGILPFRSHLNDMDKIPEISKQQWVAKHIRTVDIYTGDFRTKKFLECAYENCEELRELDERGKDPYIEATVACTISNDLHCDPDLLSELFANLPCIETLRINSNEYPFR